MRILIIGLPSGNCSIRISVLIGTGTAGTGTVGSSVIKYR